MSNASTTARRPRLATQFAWVSGGRIVAAVLQAVLLVALARQLGPGDFGLIAGAIGLIAIVQVTLDLGISTLMTRERAVRPDSPIIISALRMTLVTAILMALLIAVALTGAGYAFSPTYLSALPLAIWAAAERNADVWLSIAFADGDARINVVNVIGRRVVTLSIFLGLTMAVDDAALAYSSAAATGALSANLAARRVIRPRLEQSDVRVPVGQLLRRGRPYWINSVSTQARNVDVVVVSAVAGATQSGLYASASRLTSPLRIFPTSLATLLIPHTARLSGHADAFRRSVRQATLASGLAAVFYTLFAASVPFIVVPLLGEAYAPAISVIVIVSLSLPFAAASSLFGGILQGHGHVTVVARASAVSTLMCVVGVAIAASAFGSVGAAVALGLSYLLQFGVLVFFTMRQASREAQ